MWQTLDKKQVAAEFETFNAACRLDPFKKIHWGVLRDYEKKGYLIQHVPGKYGCITREVEKSRKYRDFSGDDLFRFNKGETECPALFCSEAGLSALARHLTQYGQSGLWLTINQENVLARRLVASLKAKFISSKIAGVGSDIYGMWYVGSRRLPMLCGLSTLNFARTSVEFDAERMLRAVVKCGPQFEVTDRGTRYGGPKRTWTRVVIRNAGESREQAEKQIEEHPLFKGCPSLTKTLAQVADGLHNVDALMLTRVVTGGLIVRHTDIALDRDVGSVRGFDPNHTMRLHIVLGSNPSCKFHIWNLLANKVSVAMAAGQVWYADVRKPHAVTNEGQTDRVHLVADVYEKRSDFVETY